MSSLCRNKIPIVISQSVYSCFAASRDLPMPMWRNSPMTIFIRMNGVICGSWTIDRKQGRGFGLNYTSVELME